jgi:hypothetical protein
MILLFLIRKKPLPIRNQHLHQKDACESSQKSKNKKEVEEDLAATMITMMMLLSPIPKGKKPCQETSISVSKRRLRVVNPRVRARKTQR